MLLSFHDSAVYSSQDVGTAYMSFGGGMGKSELI